MAKVVQTKAVFNSTSNGWFNRRETTGERALDVRSEDISSEPPVPTSSITVLFNFDVTILANVSSINMNVNSVLTEGANE